MKRIDKISKIVDIDEYKSSFEGNLNEDHSAKQFWCKQIQILIKKFAEQAMSSMDDEKTNHRDKIDQNDHILRVSSFKNDYENKVQILLNNQDQFLSVRMLLELNEQLLIKHNFDDVWKKEKQIENSKALELLGSRLKELDGILDTRNRWHEIFRGVLAGNIFDYGATQVQELLASNKNFDLNDALNKIQKRPWLIDNFDMFIERLNTKPSLKCSVVFVDNSGVDIVLGVLPFVRELIKNNIKVILCANSQPSLNDVTYKELKDVVQEASKTCSIIEKSIQNKNLRVFESGQNGCCLNFLTLNEKLLDEMIENEVDLIVIEGMGRTLHTNLNSKFKCDSTLKLAVIKNNYLALRLGGKLFDAICKYEKNS